MYVCLVTINQYGGWGKSSSTFSIYVYASTSWAHLKIKTYFSYIYGLHCEKCIMDPLALSYPLTNINIHVQYGSNLIMSYNVWLFFLKESWWSLCCIQGCQSINEDLGTGDTCTIKDQFVQCEKGTFFDGGGGGSMIRMGQSCFQAVF